MTDAIGIDHHSGVSDVYSSSFVAAKLSHVPSELLHTFVFWNVVVLSELVKIMTRFSTHDAIDESLEPWFDLTKKKRNSCQLEKFCNSSEARQSAGYYIKAIVALELIHRSYAHDMYTYRTALIGLCFVKSCLCFKASDNFSDACLPECFKFS
jgi:hypothetical protein